MLTLIINPGGVTITKRRKERERERDIYRRCQSKPAGGSARGSERRKKGESTWE